ncbi:MAG TPA: OmpA family protein [Elusimicrobiota bacterium]|nr:OmpA family protein [Elusimicrobiota bacterium]
MLQSEVPPVVDNQDALEYGKDSIQFGTDWSSAPQIPAVYFDGAKSELKPETRFTLQKNAAILKLILEAAPGTQIRVEGHCDERNTLEYNIALGQRRANVVSDYYVALGIPKTKLATISYGEERPVCDQSSEECWWKNRRGETTVRSSTGTVRIPASKLKSLQQP